MTMFLLDAQTKYLNQIFATDIEQGGLPAVTHSNLMIFFERLMDDLPLGLLLTGSACEGYFNWQRRYEVGLADDANYERLKKQKGAYSDAFVFKRCDRINMQQGILVRVERITDKKMFRIPLVDLEAYDSHSHAARMIETYTHWYRSQESAINDASIKARDYFSDEAIA